METSDEPNRNLRRAIVALSLTGLFGLMLEIRFEHREVLAERWETYIPLVYCAGMLILGAVGLYAWDRWGRILLLVGFALGFAIGIFGLWLHSDGQPGRSIRRVLMAWTLPPGDNGGMKPQLSGPPVMAPLAFLGLGAIGMVACARRCLAISEFDRGGESNSPPLDHPGSRSRT